MTTLWTKHQYAKCFGHWIVSEPECIRCFITDNCEKRTKAKSEDVKETVEQIDEDGKDESSNLTPLDNLIQRLEGQLDHESEDKNGAIIHKFRKNGIMIAAVVVGGQGRVKVLSEKLKRVYGVIGSVEEAEEILAEML